MANLTYEVPILSFYTYLDDYYGTTHKSFVIKWYDQKDSTSNMFNFTFKLDDMSNTYALNEIVADLKISSLLTYFAVENLKLIYVGNELRTPKGRSHHCDKVSFGMTNEDRNITATLDLSDFQFEVFTPNQTEEFAQRVGCGKKVISKSESFTPAYPPSEKYSSSSSSIFKCRHFTFTIFLMHILIITDFSIVVIVLNLVDLMY